MRKLHFSNIHIRQDYRKASNCLTNIEQFKIRQCLNIGHTELSYRIVSYDLYSNTVEFEFCHIPTKTRHISRVTSPKSQNSLETDADLALNEAL